MRRKGRGREKVEVVIERLENNRSGIEESGQLEKCGRGQGIVG